MAARRCEGHDNVTLRKGDATALPVDDATFDAAYCVQVLEYLPNASVALAEMYRALKPGGRIVVWDVDWSTVSWHSSDQVRMDRVLRLWDQHLAEPSLPRTLATRMRSVGFDNVRFQPHVFASGEFDAETYGVGMVPLIEQFVAGRAGIDAGEAAAWAAEQRDLGDRGEYFFSCTQFCFEGKKPRAESRSGQDPQQSPHSL
jgi:SAM-dependent methyltransferase